MISPRGHKTSGETHDEEAALVINISLLVVDILLLVVDIVLFVVDTLLQ